MPINPANRKMAADLRAQALSVVEAADEVGALAKRSKGAERALREAQDLAYEAAAAMQDAAARFERS